MALTPQQKRDRRAAASQQQRDDEAARKREYRQGHAQQEHSSRKRRREEIRAAADAGEEQANAMLDAAALRAHRHRKNINMDAALDARVHASFVLRHRKSEDEVDAAVANHPAIVKLRLQADRKRATQLPGVQARRAERETERARAHEQRDAAVAAAKQHYDRCREAWSRIRKEWYVSRTVVCTDTACSHETCFNAGCGEAVAAERLRLQREQDAEQHSKDALEALRAARRQPLRPVCTEVEVAESEGWCCDVGAEGCIKPSVSAPEPEPPYVVWFCNARRPCNWCVCSACHVQHCHPHALVHEVTED